MSARTRSRKDGGTTGFRRLFDYPAAISPRDLRALLDPQPEDMPYRVQAREGLVFIQRESLGKIDAMAPAISFFDASRMNLGCTEDLAFALALDRPAPKARLHAMLARAFARADRFAAACADELDIKEHLSSLTGALDRAIAALSSSDGILWQKNRPELGFYHDSAVGRALKYYDRLTYWDAKAREGRSESLRQGLETLEEIRSGLAIIEDTGPPFDWPVGDEARFFFLFRLAEIFTISTGEVPSFSDYQPKGRPAHWTGFAKAALDLTGLGTTNFDELSRRLGGRKRDRLKTSIEGSYGSFLQNMATWFDPDHPRDRYYVRPKCAGELHSVGRAIDRKDDGEPISWRDHLI